MSAKSLAQLYVDRPARQVRDRLEILTALIDAPSFDPVYRGQVIRIPRGHPVYRWECVVGGCERSHSGGTDLCSAHLVECREASERGIGRAAFLADAQPLARHVWGDQIPCRVCPERPATHTVWLLCRRHHLRWYRHSKNMADADFEAWLAAQEPFAGFGPCRVAVCVGLAASPIGLCQGHQSRYEKAGSPGGAGLPRAWWYGYGQVERETVVAFAAPAVFAAWCAGEHALTFPGQINVRGLRPLLAAEIRWTLFAHTFEERHTRWDLEWIQKLVNLARDRDAGSLTDLDLADFPRFHGAIAKSMLHHLRLVYFTPEQTRDAGFIETDHFGVRFPHRASHVDLTAIEQRWLRDLLWDYLAELMRSARCPRTALPVDEIRRATTELGAFLQLEAPGGGHDPRMLRREQAERFVADQRHRERHGLPSLGMKGSNCKPTTVTTTTRSGVANGVRKLLRDALDNGVAEQIGLDREFITTMPFAGPTPGRARRPFPDEVARALADEANLAALAALDPSDHGLRDVWEAIVLTGRRVNEVLKLRAECVGRHGGIAVLWHDQTKVGNYDAAIRIPERLYALLAERQHKTIERHAARYGRAPSRQERIAMALFPAMYRNPDATQSLSYQWFHRGFRQWVDTLDIEHCVPHQARHTLATNLLRHGATLTHIRRYLGQVSDRMAEHYIHLTQSDLDEVLQHVWVAGPATAHPGQQLSGGTTPMTKAQAHALAIDLSRRSTPAEGGFCTFQPVVDGGACPWNLDCHNCDKFVLSGADLLYWRRKREQWRILAEGAPDEATSRYLHDYFEPTAHAIDGLEKALAGLGLLDQALALDLRKPQDYFQRVWTTAFRADQLAEAAIEADDDFDEQEPGR